jgi:hypothetical protein
LDLGGLNLPPYQAWDGSGELGNVAADPGKDTVLIDIATRTDGICLGVWDAPSNWAV